MIGKIRHPRQDRPFPPKLKISKQLRRMPASSNRTLSAKPATGRGTSGFAKGFILEDCFTVDRYHHGLQPATLTCQR